jgi:hypothetical protein
MRKEDKRFGGGKYARKMYQIYPNNMSYVMTENQD